MQTVFLICPDDVLQKIIEKKPVTETEMLTVPGFNQRIYNKVGREFLEEIKEFKRSRETLSSGDSSPLDDGPAKTAKLLEQGYNFKEIAELRKISEGELSKEIITLIELNPNLDITYLFNYGELERIINEMKKGYVDLKDLKSRVGSHTTYSKIRIAEAKYKLLGL
jgi:hypothetical protein